MESEGGCKRISDLMDRNQYKARLLEISWHEAAKSNNYHFCSTTPKGVLLVKVMEPPYTESSVRWYENIQKIADKPVAGIDYLKIS